MASLMELIFEDYKTESPEKRKARENFVAMHRELEEYRELAPEEALNAWSKKCFDSFEARLKPKTNFRETGFHYFPPALFKDAVEVVFGEDTKNKRFLELGGGLRFNTILASLLGFDAYSIELNKELHEQSFEALEETKIVLQRDTQPKFFQGNYFTKEYTEDVNCNQALAQTFFLREVGSKEKPIIIDGLDGKGKEYFFLEPNTTTDIYEENKIPFKSFDVFFGYFWGPEAPAVIEQFAKYAKDDATFLCCAHYRPAKLYSFIEALGLREERIYFTKKDSVYGRFHDLIHYNSQAIYKITKK